MGRQTAIELFREKMSDMGQLGPVSLYLENAASLTDPTGDRYNLQLIIDYNRVQDAQIKAQELDTHQGIISGNKDSIRGGIAERVADAQGIKEDKAARAAKSADDTAFYLSLSKDYIAGLQFARQMFNNMSDQELFDFSERMEAETGKSVHAWAEEILTEEQRERRPGETDAEYERRIQQQTIAAMMSPDGEFLPEFADHPPARWVQQQEEFKSVQNEMSEFVASRPDGQSAETDRAELAARNITDGGLRVEFANAATETGSLDKSGLDNVLQEDRDMGRDGDLDNDERVANNEATFDLFS